MKKLKLIPLILGTSVMTITPVFASSCTSETTKAEQVIILGEKSCHVAVKHSFTHSFTAYVLPTETLQEVNWSLNIDLDNAAIKPYVNISKTGLLTISEIPETLANKKFTIYVVASDVGSEQVFDSKPFVINVDEKLQIVGPERVVYQNESGNSLGSWTVNADLDGVWEIANYEQAISNDKEFQYYFELIQNNTIATIQPTFLGGWTDLGGASYNLTLKFTPNNEEYKDSFQPFNLVLDVLEPDSMTVTPTKGEDYSLTPDQDKIFTISNYGSFSSETLLYSPDLKFYLTQVTRNGTDDNHWYTFSETSFELTEDKAIITTSEQERETEQSPFRVAIKLLPNKLTVGLYYLTMTYNGILLTNTCEYISNFIVVN